MLSLQGPDSRAILQSLITAGRPPEPLRNYLSIVQIDGAPVMVSRTGYTGEPLCFELFAAREHGLALWDKLAAAGAEPVGLGARDTLRLEAGLPLYGHELGADPDGDEIPVFAVSLAPMAVSFSPLKGEFVGRRRWRASRRPTAASWRATSPTSPPCRGACCRSPCSTAASPAGRRRVARAASRPAGLTSGTAVPYWGVAGQGVLAGATHEQKHARHRLGLPRQPASLEDDVVTVDVRGTPVDGRRGALPSAQRRTAGGPRPSSTGAHTEAAGAETAAGRGGCPTLGAARRRAAAKVGRLLQRALDNHRWRHTECINLIPSEMTVSARPGAPARHRRTRRSATPSTRRPRPSTRPHVFYYQGTALHLPGRAAARAGDACLPRAAPRWRRAS